MTGLQPARPPVDGALIGRRVRELRRGARLTQVRFAARVGYSVSLVRLVEQGRAPASPEFVRSVARLFGLRPQDVDPDVEPEIVQPPAPRTDDAVMLFADMLTVLPGAAEQLGARHFEGPDGQCAGCADQAWPCITGWAVARAAWLARGGS